MIRVPLLVCVVESKSCLSITSLQEKVQYSCIYWKRWRSICDSAELRRISAAGGYVELNRVNGRIATSDGRGFIIFSGSLALSRALGDFAFKKNPSKSPEEQIITGE